MPNVFLQYPTVFEMFKQKWVKSQLLNQAHISLHHHAQPTEITRHLVNYALYFTGCTGFGTVRLRFWAVWWCGNHLKKINCCGRLVPYAVTSVDAMEEMIFLESMLMCVQHLPLFDPHHMLAACKTFGMYFSSKRHPAMKPMDILENGLFMIISNKSTTFTTITNAVF